MHTISCRDFYCHSVGHYLGLDVHDTNTIGPYRTLEPGVVLAIEPGLYIPNHPQFGLYAGIGVRIEDDVLITQTGCEVGSFWGGGRVGGGVCSQLAQVPECDKSSAHEGDHHGHLSWHQSRIVTHDALSAYS